MKKNLHFQNFRRASGENLSKQLSKLHSNLPEEHCWRIICLKKHTNSWFCWVVGWKLIGRILRFQSNLWREIVCLQKNYRFRKFLRAPGEKFAARLSKMQSSFGEEHFWKNHLLERNFRFIIFFGLWFKYFWQDCQNCII